MREQLIWKIVEAVFFCVFLTVGVHIRFKDFKNKWIKICFLFSELYCNYKWIFWESDFQIIPVNGTKIS